MFAPGQTVGQAEWIIDDTCLVFVILFFFLQDNSNLLTFLVYCEVLVRFTTRRVIKYGNFLHCSGVLLAGDSS